MADIDLLPSRGVPFAALVDSTGVATNGSSTVAQLAAKGMRAICAVDATGVSVGGANVAQLASAGIRAFCPVDENGVAQDSSTADMLRTRGIRPMVLLNATGIALTGSSTMLVLAGRGLQCVCPLDETGNATTMGPVILLSNSTIPDNATVGTNVGVLSVAGGSGTYTFTLTSNPGNLFALSGTNGVNLNTAAAMTVGTYPITVQAAGGVPTPITRTLSIAVTPHLAAPVNTAPPVISGTTTVGQTLTSTGDTWTGFPTPTYAYQWKRGGTAISGATASSYSLVTADVGTTITVTVTASNSSGNASATSAGVGPIAALPTAPVNTSPPVISGTTTVGQTLTITGNTWTGTPTITYAYQWLRNGANISGATASTYLLVSADLGATITVTVTATNSVGNASATSAGVGPIIAAAPTLTLDAAGASTNSPSGPAPFTVSVTTVAANAVIIVAWISSTGGLAGAPTSPGLTFTVAYNGSPALGVGYAYAVAASPGPKTITLTPPADGTAFMTAVAFSVAGAPSALFDGAPVTATPDPVSITTTNANDFLFAVFKMSAPNPSAGAGWTGIVGQDYLGVEYKIVSSVGTYSATLTSGAGTANPALVHALKAG